MDSKALFFIFLLHFWITSVFSYKVSLYGNSYINLPIQEAKSSTNIRLKFKTSLQTGLILATIGRIDYLLLSLEQSKLKLDLKIADYETEIWSPPNIQFDDRLWHEVTITRYERNITFQVNEHFIREQLPEGIGELSIHFGVFLGGFGDFTAPSVGHDYVNFRGCISDVYYNNISVLKRAKEATKHVVVEKVTWTCASEFDALNNDEISFLYPESFAVHISEEAEAEQKIISFQFRTIRTHVPLLLSWNKQSSLKLEIFDGKLLFDVNANEMQFNGNTSDGQWHLFQLHFDEDRYTVALDQETNTLDASVSLFQFKEYFIGGVPELMRKKAAQKGLKAIEENFQGCMKNIQIGGSLTGLSSFKSTEGLTTGCIWEYPCLEKSPCIPSSVCHQERTDKFWCECDQHYCIRADYREKYSIFAKKPVGFEILQITPALVSEGQWTYISGTNIFLTEEIAQNIPDNQILFYIINQPKYGNLEKVFEPTGTPMINFTYKDVLENKVRYVHGGDEQHHDFITLNLILPHKVNEKQRKYGQSHVLSTKFMLHFNVAPINDAPTLTIPRNKIFVVVQGIPKRFTTDFISLYDPDSTTENLIFKVIRMSPAINSTFEVAQRTVDAFSYQELMEEKVMLKVNEKIKDEQRFEIFLEVSDGIETSAAVGLQVNAVPLELRLVNNSGLNMIHHSKALITNFNLSFAANVDEDSNLIVTYDLVQQPEYGIIEKMRMADSTWSTPVNSFTSEQIILGQIRYSHLHGKPTKDEFKFTATLGPVTTQTYDFRINLFQFQITSVSHRPLEIHGDRETTISPENLSYQTLFHKTLSEDIRYKIVEVPIYGSLFLTSKKLHGNETFTQQDVNLCHLKYRTNYPTFSTFMDQIKFVVSIENSNTFLHGNLSVEFTPNVTQRIEEVHPENVQVVEGSRSTISRINFPFAFNKHIPQFLHFNLTEPPTHGFICRYTQNFKTQSLHYFTVSQLQAGDIYYCHDDSETESDQLKLLVYAQDKTEFQYIALINVSVVLRNDNEPKLVTINEVLKVVKGEQKIISTEILNYTDDDITTTDKEITYVHVVATNGDLFLSNKPSNTFTQADVNENFVHFVHRGPELVGNISFVVSDGLHETRGMLKVKASDPFIKFIGLKVFSLRERESLAFDDSVVRFEINFDPRPTDIKYEVVSWPNYGILHFANSTNKIITFNHNDILQNQVSYTNLNITSHDKIRLRVTWNELSDEVEIIIKIYPSSYWQDLFVVNNETLLVEEEKSVKIKKQNLEIGHQSTIDPKEIIFKVKRKPKFGYLHMETSDSENLENFDQQTVNEGKVFYVQTVSNVTDDFFTVDVTNGIVWLKNFYIHVKIFPSRIAMVTQSLRIKKGSSLTIYAESLQPTSDYYKLKIIDYKVIEKPKHGKIIIHGGINTNRFTQNQLMAGHVKYTHSGLSDSNDSIRLIARTPSKLSDPFAINIIPYSEDNESPKIIANSPTPCGLNRKCVIESKNLKISSKYVTPDAITYYITSTRGGFVVNELHGKEDITTFTQDQINNGLITFVLEKSSEPKPEFSFYATAGNLNTSTAEHPVTPFTFIPSSIKPIQTKMVHVPPGGKTAINDAQIEFSEILGHQQMGLDIVQPPQAGTVQYQSKDGMFSSDARHFSQSDIANGRLFYENEKFSVWELQKGKEISDSFRFKILPNFVDHANEYAVQLNVSFYEEILNAIKYESIRLEEGGRAPLKMDFSAAVNYLKDKTTGSNTMMVKCCYSKHGEVLANEKKIYDQSLYIEDFDQYGMTYVHDHSDTTEDEVSMAVYLLQGNVFLGDVRVPVAISPINDQKFYLLTQNPSITMVSGESFTITNEVLLTQDVDTPSYKVEYTVISPPPIGEILKIHPDNSLIDISKFQNTFTQDDINQKRILYVNNQKDLNNASRTIQFKFKVWDSQYEAMHGTFTINIVPVKVQCKNSKPTYLLQDNTKATLDLSSLWVDTNVKKSRLHFTIVEPPKFGSIKEVTESNTREITEFTFSKLESKKLEYVVGGSVTEDAFKSLVTVTNSKASCTIRTEIRLKPLVIINSMILQTSEFIDKVPVSTTLDPESPYKLRQLQNVVFTMTKPKYGEFVSILRKNDSDLPYEPVATFTLKDIDEGFIYYRPNNEKRSVTDEFTYKVTTNTSTASATSFIKYVKASATEPDEPSTEDQTAQIITFTLLGIGFIVATIIVFYTLRCCITLKAFTEQKLNEKPPPLPIPPGFTLNNGRLYSHSSQSLSNAGTPTLLSNLPNFKIIAMHETDSTTCRDSELDFVNFDTIDDDEMMAEQRDDEKELMSSESPSQTPNFFGNDLDGYKAAHNPLLRRNQYWV